jgi:hypothetical protein
LHYPLVADRTDRTFHRQKTVASASDNDPAYCPKEPHSNPTYGVGRQSDKDGTVREGTMPNAKDPVRAPAQQRTRTDLMQQYRPIGIGAVAAALTIKGKEESDAAQTTDAQSERQREIESLAA